MSDDARLNLRDLPAVEPVEWPERLSQTLLRHHDACPRSAYLYARYSGGTPSHDLDRGTAVHAFAERMIVDLIRHGEKSLMATAEGEDPAHAARSVASLTGAIVEEILDARPDLTLSAAERDDVREMAYHLAVGFDVDPADIVAVERKMVLDLDCGWTVSGRIDLAEFVNPTTARVTDWKSSWAVPSQGDFDSSFQTRFYSLLLAFGQPVEGVLCPECEGKPLAAAPIAICSRCDGDGYVERRLPAVGEYLQWITAREVYPRYLADDGSLRQRSMVVSRQELVDFRADLEAQGRRIRKQIETWSFPAVPGSHCTRCPCQPECPLPAHLRRHAGEIESNEQAAEAAEWVETTSAQLTATKKELRSYSNVHGPVRYGTDKVYEFSTSESWSTDWENLELAIERAHLYGEPLDLSLYRQPRVSTSYRSRKLTAEELEPEVATTEEVLDADARWGSKAPY